ncbi:hypothetical protein PR048_000140 [Dryococelus australis]|uniref:Uncharacterized protein n=1 Tax=Dryococelus australis TaxID=614101 RepID=A0ABQ9IG09_9NEOP|nr:hypothetical protein PR048_000140 [Dryococelus australis]
MKRNYNWMLREIATKSKTATGSVPGSIRRLLNADRQFRLRFAVTSAIRYRSVDDLPSQQRIDELAKDMHNGPCHVFGDHSRCGERGYFCKGLEE